MSTGKADTDRTLATIAAIAAGIFVAILVFLRIRPRREPVRLVVQQDKPIAVDATLHQSAPAHVVVYPATPVAVKLEMPAVPLAVKVATGFAKTQPDADATKG